MGSFIGSYDLELLLLLPTIMKKNILKILKTSTKNLQNC